MAADQPLSFSQPKPDGKRAWRWALAVLAAAALMAIPLLPAFAQAPTGTWYVDSVSGTGSPRGSMALFELRRDGRIGTSLGCNRITGKPRISGDRISFGPMRMTRMTCSPPLAAREQAYLSALSSVERYAVEGETLTLMDSAGTVLVVMTKL